MMAIRRFATRRNIESAPKIRILPPLPLLRRILRAHRSLPIPQRILGDSYVRAEFKAHKSIENPAQIIGFLSQWQKYLEALSGDKWKQEKLDLDAIQRLDPDKQIQLYELMVAAQDKPSEYGAIPEVELPRPDSLK